MHEHKGWAEGGAAPRGLGADQVLRCRNYPPHGFPSTPYRCAPPHRVGVDKLHSGWVLNGHC